jgi:hypothetical protein
MGDELIEIVQYSLTAPQRLGRRLDSHVVVDPANDPEIVSPLYTAIRSVADIYIFGKSVQPFDKC